MKYILYIYNTMRNFGWLLIMLIGMISLTGFSTTADLTQDSSTAIECIDIDVGTLNAVSVDIEKEFKETLDVSTFTKTLIINQKSYLNITDKIMFQDINTKLNVILEIHQPPAYVLSSNRARENI